MQTKRVIKLQCGILVSLLLIATTYAKAQTVTNLYLFTSSLVPVDGIDPAGSLIMDSSGNLYGTTTIGGAFGYGTVFELAKSSSGTYTENVLYSFTGSNGDGRAPQGSLIMDPSGNLYGTTSFGGSPNCTNGCGTVFELVSNSGTYTEKILYSFANSGGDGANPSAGLIMDSSGSLYGTTPHGGTSGDGTLFELVNNDGTYTETVLYSFTGSGGDGAIPSAGLIMDSSGNLYGTTEAGGVVSQSGGCGQGCGSVFELTPAATSSNSPGLSTNNTFTGNNTFTQTITGSITGNAATVTNGVYTSGMYADPGWITSLDGSKITGTVANATNATFAGTAALATFAAALQATPTQCATNQFANGIAANGNANCLQPASANLSDSDNLVFNMQPNIFTGGKQTLPASTQTYASLNIPNTGQPPIKPAMGDLWLTTADTHLKFLDSTNTTQSLAFLSDVGTSGAGLLGSNNTFTGTNSFSQTINGNISGNAGTATLAALATTATTANNALALGGVSPSGYALVGENNFTGTQTMPSASVSGEVTAGSIAIGGGTPIKEYVSVTLSVTLPKMGAGGCTTFTTAALTGFTPGTSDTIALGVPSSLINIPTAFVMWQAWETSTATSPTITIRACNIGNTGAATGTIRVDVYKH